MARAFDEMPYNRIEKYGAGSRRAVAASGISYLYAKEALNELGADATLYKIGTPYPMPEKLTKDFLAGADSVLVLEELDPSSKSSFSSKPRAACRCSANAAAICRGTENIRSSS